MYIEGWHLNFLRNTWGRFRCLMIHIRIWLVFYFTCHRVEITTLQASTLTFFLACPFGQLTKKSTCPTQSFSCSKKYNKNYRNQRIIISNLCKMFWLLSHKHYLVLSLLIQKCTNRHYDYDIFNRQINKHLEVRHKVIGIKRCHHGTCMSV